MLVRRGEILKKPRPRIITSPITGTNERVAMRGPYLFSFGRMA
jgi:hypothetical protein